MATQPSENAFKLSMAGIRLSGTSQIWKQNSQHNTETLPGVMSVPSVSSIKD
jgi:hypothetical protein